MKQVHRENEIKGDARPHPDPLPQARERNPKCAGILMLSHAAHISGVAGTKQFDRPHRLFPLPEPTHPRPLPGGQQTFVRALSVPIPRGVRSPLKKQPGEGTGPTIDADLRGNLVGRVPPRGEPDVFQQAVRPGYTTAGPTFGFSRGASATLTATCTSCLPPPVMMPLNGLTSL